jgi:hypothetical protein
MEETVEMSHDKPTPAELRAEAARLEAQARHLYREAAALERHAAGRRLCEGSTKYGRPCRNDARTGRAYCAYHDPDLTAEQRQEAISPRWASIRRRWQQGGDE